MTLTIISPDNSWHQLLLQTVKCAKCLPLKLLKKMEANVTIVTSTILFKHIVKRYILEGWLSPLFKSHINMIDGVCALERVNPTLFSIAHLPFFHSETQPFHLCFQFNNRLNQAYFWSSYVQKKCLSTSFVDRHNSMKIFRIRIGRIEASKWAHRTVCLIMTQ